MIKAILLDEKDNVVTVMKPVSIGDEVCWNEGNTLISLEDIPKYHKIAICDIPSKSKVIKYGHAIGIATEDIKKGAYVHIHNCIGLSMEGSR